MKCKEVCEIWLQYTGKELNILEMKQTTTEKLSEVIMLPYILCTKQWVTVQPITSVYFVGFIVIH